MLEMSINNVFYHMQYLSEWKTPFDFTHTLRVCLHWWSYLAVTLSAELLYNSAAAAASGALSCL